MNSDMKPKFLGVGLACCLIMFSSIVSATNSCQWFYISLTFQLTKAVLGVIGMRGWRWCGFDGAVRSANSVGRAGGRGGGILKSFHALQPKPVRNLLISVEVQVSVRFSSQNRSNEVVVASLLLLH